MIELQYSVSKIHAPYGAIAVAAFSDYCDALEYAVSLHGRVYKTFSVQLKDEWRDCVINTMYRNPVKG